ncbi:MAG: deferrochelatase/peroxidase EfeB, partial [Planctomycetia bacterium]
PSRAAGSPPASSDPSARAAHPIPDWGCAATSVPPGQPGSAVAAAGFYAAAQSANRPASTSRS